MKTIILAISLTILNFASFTTIAQTYTTESKSSMDRHRARKNPCTKKVNAPKEPSVVLPIRGISPPF